MGQHKQPETAHLVLITAQNVSSQQSAATKKLNPRESLEKQLTFLAARALYH